MLVREHPLYPIWCNMKARCYNPNHTWFHNYGGRGITVCDEWRNDFWQFANDIGERPDGYTLERVKNDLGYSPDNCKWATRKDQAANRRNRSDANMITALGRTQTLSEWAKESGLSVQVIRWRIKNGWDADSAVSDSTSYKKRH